MNDEERTPKLIVALTATPQTMDQVVQTLEGLQDQTLAPHKVVLCLPKEGCQEEAERLSDNIAALIETEKLEVLWCASECDLRCSCLAVLAQHAHDVVVTLGPKQTLGPHSLEQLWSSYLKYPSCIVCSRASLITFTQNGAPLPSLSWLDTYVSHVGEPSGQLCPLLCGATLYPPSIFPLEALDSKVVAALCMDSAELWLCAWELHLNIPIVLNPNAERDFSHCLLNQNRTGGLLDIQLSVVRDWFVQSNKTDPFVISCEGASGVEGMERAIRLAADNQRSLQSIANEQIMQMTKLLQQAEKERSALERKLGKQREENKSLKNKLAREKSRYKKVTGSVAYKVGTTLAKPVRVTRKLMAALKRKKDSAARDK